MSESPDWMLLERAYRDARSKAVGFSLVYQEASDEWYCTVYSAAPAENWVGRSRGFDVAIAQLCEQIESL